MKGLGFRLIIDAGSKLLDSGRAEKFSLEGGMLERPPAHPTISAEQITARMYRSRRFVYYRRVLLATTESIRHRCEFSRHCTLGRLVMLPRLKTCIFSCPNCILKFPIGALESNSHDFAQRGKVSHNCSDQHNLFLGWLLQAIGTCMEERNGYLLCALERTLFDVPECVGFYYF